MNTHKNPLFSDFTPISKQQWVEKVNSDLKGEDFNRKLVFKNLNKLDFQPFYTVQDQVDYLIDTGENTQEIVNYRNINVISVFEANKEALKAINEGANGLLFSLNKNVSISELLNGINLNNIVVSFNISNEVTEISQEYFNFVQQNSINPVNLNGFLDFGVISNYLTTGKSNPKAIEDVASSIKLWKAYPNFKIVTISGTTYQDSGANQVQEVAFTLNALVYVIEELLKHTINVEEIFKNLHVQLGVGSEYFIEIGKFRAFNSLLHQIAKKYEVIDFNHMLTAKTSVWSKSVTDSHTNMLRATTETMSAMLGNVDGIFVDAFDSEFAEHSAFSSRIATNIATILKEESYFGKVANPVDGSYYIEEVSSKIAETALQLFKAIEIEGGFYKAFESGTIQAQIAEIRQEKIKLISQRRLPIVGVNKYPNLMETVPTKVLGGLQKINSKVLTPRRASLEIEALRKVTEQLVEQLNKRPVVELTSFGNLTMRKARAAFSYDFIGVSGFQVLQEKSYSDFEQAAETSAKSDADVVVICSSDQDYEETALNFVQTFRAINSDKVLLLAGNPETIFETLAAAGLDGCINLKTDVIQAISEVQRKIQNNYKIVEA